MNIHGAFFPSDRIHPEDLPLNSDDMAICQRVLETINLANGFEMGSAESISVAWRVIGLYKRGEQDYDRLLKLVGESGRAETIRRRPPRA